MTNDSDKPSILDTMMIDVDVGGGKFERRPLGKCTARQAQDWAARQETLVELMAPGTVKRS
jgi:hypothetical protein